MRPFPEGPAMTLEGLEVREDRAFYRPQGDITVPEFIVELAELVKACRGLGVKRLLMDVRGLRHPPLTTFDRFDINDQTAGVWDRGIRAVLLVRPDQHDPTSFGLLVARNRGFHYEVFIDEAAALAALEAPEAP
jgi:hypothetical protein